MAEILYLIKCTACNKRIKQNENFTVWENEHYCEPCFDEYLDMINPSEFLKQTDKKSNSIENSFGLSDEQYSKFISIQTKHSNAWSSPERKEQHSLENIERVEYNTSDNLFYVYYKGTNHFMPVWYHYDANGGSWW
ncbi:hypothetical protein [Planomicrobium okeanokoites]|uniref:hypothetical protein n=1 Tax=Planomicrobium okeanokoites TaxID=244 RepID=UPI000A02D149|nr:hypothetical protein [Planomicrobium okeanokoites]